MDRIEKRPTAWGISFERFRRDLALAVRRLVLRDAMKVVGLGAVLGLAGALLSTRMLSSLLFDVHPADPVALVAACLILVTIGFCAAYLPARYAARIDPARALRSD